VIRFGGLLYYIGSIMYIYAGTQSRNDFRQLKLGPTSSFHAWTGRQWWLAHLINARFLLEIGFFIQHYQVIIEYKEGKHLSP
jgi:hypothetical protein